MKRIHLVSLGIALVFLAVLTAIFVYPQKAKRETWEFPNEVALHYPAEWNDRQSYNACGPYSAAAVIRIQTNKDVSSEQITQNTSWRFRGYTLPVAVVSDLKKNGISVDEYIVALPDPDKLSWLRNKLGKSSPVIILGRKSNVLHYVTLVGYDQQSFDVYDSIETKGEGNMTVDKNGQAPGNATWTDENLLDMWNSGGVFGLYKNYAIVPKK